MMTTFQRQIETVGLHQAFISRAADRVQRRCSRIGFHRRRGCVLRQREARLQTDRHCEGRPRQVHSAFRNNEILGGRGDPDRHRGIIHFHPPAQTAPRRPQASPCWWLKLSGYHKCTFSLKPTPSWTKDWTRVEGRFSSGCCWSEANCICQATVCCWQGNWPQSAHINLKKTAKICMFLHKSSNSWGKTQMEWGVLRRRTSIRLRRVWMENGNIYVSTGGQHNRTRQQSFVFWI